jgi:hypothetical protein
MPAVMYQKAQLKVADELFLIVALLHREHPDQEAFEIGQILSRAKQEGLGAHRSDQRSLRLHAYEHAAANVPPGKGGKYRLVFRERDNRIRLLNTSDYIHPDRHQKLFPAYEEVPEKYHELLDWAKRRSEGQLEAGPNQWLEGLKRLKGKGKEIWRGIDPDAYVRNLREGWE